MRKLLCSALLLAVPTIGIAAPKLAPTFSGGHGSLQITQVHHEASDDSAPAQLLTALPADDWPVTNWYKQSVYDLGGTKLGEIADVLVNHDGKNTAVLIGVGGFLGVGEKYVAVPFDAVHFKKKDNSWYPVLNTTKDALKNASGYRYDRNAQRWVPENVPASVGGSAPR
jgi:sporulation protein YlmC with PRC-barrel domain